MQHEIKKVTLIVNELMTMMLQNDAKDVQVNVNREGHTTTITLFQGESNYSDEFLQDLRYSLNTQRQSEVEGYYWQLCGDDDTGEELFLVGAMVDEATVEVIDGGLTIKLVRSSDY